MAKEKTVTLTRNVLIGGEHNPIGKTVKLPENDADYLIAMGKAVEGKQKVDVPAEKVEDVVATAVPGGKRNR